MTFYFTVYCIFNAPIDNLRSIDLIHVLFYSFLPRSRCNVYSTLWKYSILPDLDSISLASRRFEKSCRL